MLNNILLNNTTAKTMEYCLSLDHGHAWTRAATPLSSGTGHVIGTPTTTEARTAPLTVEEPTSANNVNVTQDVAHMLESLASGQHGRARTAAATPSSSGTGRAWKALITLSTKIANQNVMARCQRKKNVMLVAVETMEYGANGTEARARLTTTAATDTAASPDSVYKTHTNQRRTRTVNQCATGTMKTTRIATLDAANRTNFGAHGHSGTARPSMVAVMVHRTGIANVSTTPTTQTLSARKDAAMERHINKTIAMQDAVNRTKSGQNGVNGSAM